MSTACPIGEAFDTPGLLMIDCAAVSNSWEGFIMGLAFDQPATYRILVKGYLDASWSDRLGGMAIEAAGQAEGAPETSLVGWLPDQAALFGVLNTLYDRHLPLRSVEVIRLEGEPQGEEVA